MATVTLTQETVYEFNIEDFVKEFDLEFKDWLNESEEYVPTEGDKLEFANEEIHNLGGDDIRYMSSLFSVKDDDFTMDIRYK